MESFRKYLSERNLSEGIVQERLFQPIGIFQNGIFQKESFRKYFRKYFQQNRNLSEWNLSEGIFQKIFSAKPESFRMESFRRNLSENIFSTTGIFSNRIFQKEYFRKYFQ
jgi:hypothetical protein